MVETMFDYKYYLDKISEFILSTFEREKENEERIRELTNENRSLQLRLGNSRHQQHGSAASSLMVRLQQTNQLQPQKRQSNQRDLQSSRQDGQ